MRDYTPGFIDTADKPRGTPSAPVPGDIPPALAQALAQRGHEIEAEQRRTERKVVIRFSDPSTEAPVGELLIVDGKLTFEGEADEAALLMLRAVVSQHDAALQALAQAIRGTHEGHRDGLVLVGTTAVTRDGLRRGAAMLGMAPPVFDGRG